MIRSTRTPKIALAFPDWTVARNDPSSFTQRLLNVWAGVVDFQVIEQVKKMEEQDLLKYSLGAGHLYRFNLLDDDMPDVAINPNGTRTWPSLSSVTATNGDDSYSLTEVTTLEELLYNLPTRIALLETQTITDRTIYTRVSGVETLTTIHQLPHRLKIEVTGSTNYYKQTASRNVTVSGLHRIIITGRDINYQSVVETVEIPDDGIYLARNFFTEVEAVDPTGFDGDISIYLYNVSDYVEDRYRIAIGDYAQGPLRLRLVEDDIEDNPYYLQYFTPIEKLGESYRDGQDEIPENEDLQWEQYILGLEGTFATILDIAVHPDTARLYALDDSGNILIYDIGPTPFGPPAVVADFTPTLATYIELDPLSHWAHYATDLQFFTVFKRMRLPIHSVQIIRVSPSAVVEYLQSDKVSWDVSSYTFYGEDIDGAPSPDISWKDFPFTSSMSEFGQWSYFCKVQTSIDTTVFHTAVMVDSILPVAHFSVAVAIPWGLFFDHNNHLVVFDSDGIYVYQEFLDQYLADFSNHQVLLKESYDSVEVTK